MSKQDNFLDLKLYKNQQKQLLLDRIKPNFRNNNQLEIIHNIIDKCETKFDVDQIVFLLTSKEESNFISDESLVIESEQTITILEKDLKLSFYASQRERERERVLRQGQIRTLRFMQTTYINKRERESTN